MTYSVLIVGLGRIAFGYDAEKQLEDVALSHARAFHDHSEFMVVGGVDPSGEKCALFSDLYECAAYKNLEEALGKTDPDIVVISAMTELHGSILRRVLAWKTPQAILCEKPLSYERDEARMMIDLCKEKSCSLYVNYLRRSEPGVREVKRRLKLGEIGSPVKGVAWYTKGLLHNGSHFLNLLEYWLGETVGFHIINKGHISEGVDVEPDVEITFKNGVVTFLAAKKENYSFHEIDLIAANGRLRYQQGGAKITWQRTVPDEVFNGYTVLSEDEEEILSDTKKVQWHVADQLALSLHGDSFSLCSGKSALQTLEFLMSIRMAL